MTIFAERYRVESSRLKNWDYTSPGVYFVTICTIHKNKFFGKIVEGEMVFSRMGIIAKNELLKTFLIRRNVKLHEYVIMPNHVHILMEISHGTFKSRDVL